ncbi:large-conductance mechanosensitive channel protein MscL [Clostridium sp. C8-1-8]|uniref:large-conductance mechanosensitive channel protein MscL n=1 Tax=Clostridium sp. C8-1-8 TaxID=2698831 RepID=UPI001368F105|nr:large-conductance mechanosensitive channel protein MscL [Clostridium sp. C8-1-8]
MFKDFRNFAVKGNVLDLAIGVIIGGAFGKIVTSLVNDIIMPILGLVLGGLNFSYLKLVIRKASPGNPGLTINYGQFIQAIIDFLIVSISIFLFIRLIEKFKKNSPDEELLIKTSREEELLTDIRDLLKNKFFS